MNKHSFKSSLQKQMPAWILLIAILGVWQGVCSFRIVPEYLLPSPVEVLGALWSDRYLLASHSITTLYEALLGLGIGIVFGGLVAILMDRFSLVYRALNPFIIVSQTIPTIAIAPLLVLWLGYDMLPKVVLVALTTFFPITVALVGGLQSIDSDLIDLMRTMKATSWQIFRQVKLPLSAKAFFSGLKISATYAIVAAVISEWLGGYNGLGVYMTRVRKSYAYDRMFAVILVISVLSVLLMWIVYRMERSALPWISVKDDLNESE